MHGRPGEADVPDCVDTPINYPEKLEAYYEMVDEQVREDVVFDGNRIVEILLWD